MTPEIRDELDRMRELALLNLQGSNNNLVAISRLEQSQERTQQNLDALALRVDALTASMEQMKRAVDYLLSKD